jgi:UDP-N-acetylmuramoylalanine-D-glutamate ligase
MVERSDPGRISVTACSLDDPSGGPGGDIVLVTALRADELPTGTSRDQAASALRRVVERASGAVVVNGADPVAVGLAAASARVPVHVTGAPDAEPLAQVRGDRLVLRQPGGGDAVLPVTHLRLASRAYVPAATASIAAALLAGAPLESASAIGDVRIGPDMGVVVLGTRRDVRWLVDTGATEPGRAIAGIEAGTPGRTLLIAGGLYGGQPLARWGAALGAVRYVLLYGPAADPFADAARAHTTIVRCADLDDAASTASRLCRRGDTVVFAPGCLPERGTPRFEAERFAEAALGISFLAAA